MKIDLLPRPEPLHPLWTVSLVGIAGLLALADLWAVGTWINSRVQTRVNEASYQDLQAKIPALQRQAAELQRRETLAKQVDALQKWASSRPDFQSEVHLLSRLLPGGGRLLTVQYAGNASYEVQAALPDLASVATYLRALQNDTQVATVTVKSVTRRPATPSAGSPPIPEQPGTPSTRPPGGTPSPSAVSPAAPGPTGFVSAPRGLGSLPPWVGHLASLLPWTPGVARASDGAVPEPPDSGKQPSGNSPADAGRPPAGGTLSGEPVPQPTVYILDCSITLGR